MIVATDNIISVTTSVTIVIALMSHLLERLMENVYAYFQLRRSCSSKVRQLKSHHYTYLSL